MDRSQRARWDRLAKTQPAGRWLALCGQPTAAVDVCYVAMGQAHGVPGFAVRDIGGRGYRPRGRRFWDLALSPPSPTAQEASTWPTPLVLEPAWLAGIYSRNDPLGRRRVFRDLRVAAEPDGLRDPEAGILLEGDSKELHRGDNYPGIPQNHRLLHWAQAKVLWLLCGSSHAG